MDRNQGKAHHERRIKDRGRGSRSAASVTSYRGWGLWSGRQRRKGKCNGAYVGFMSGDVWGCGRAVKRMFGYAWGTVVVMRQLCAPSVMPLRLVAGHAHCAGTLRCIRDVSHPDLRVVKVRGIYAWAHSFLLPFYSRKSEFAMSCEYYDWSDGPFSPSPGLFLNSVYILKKWRINKEEILTIWAVKSSR